MKITVHTEPELVKLYYQDASPISTTKKKPDPFEEHPVRSRSRSSKYRSPNRFRTPSHRSQKLKSQSPMRVVKIKADNTYNYKLPPYVVESFWRHLLTSDENLKKLKDLYDNLPVPVKPTYTILDYINGMDYIVRKIETELNIQDREVHIGPESGKMTDFDKSDHRYRSESDSMFDSRLNNNLDAKVKLDENTQTIEGVEHRNLN